MTSIRHVPRLDRWFRTAPVELRRAPKPARAWLAWPDSLTERLADHLGDSVLVRVLSERCDRLLADERDRLQLVVTRTARVREVQLEVRGEPYVVARTVFPDSTARVMNHALGKLGTRSLGSLLFGALRAPVQLREFTHLEHESALRRMLRSHLPEVPEPVWARRAVHLLRGEPLLVTEVFLPRLLPMHPQSRSVGP